MTSTIYKNNNKLNPNKEQLNDIDNLINLYNDKLEIPFNLIQLSETLRKAFHVNILSSEIINNLQSSGFKFSWSSIDSSFLNTEEKFSIVKMYHKEKNIIPSIGATYRGYDVYSWFRNINKNGKIKKETRNTINGMRQSKGIFVPEKIISSNGMRQSKGIFVPKKIISSPNLELFKSIFGIEELKNNIDDCLKYISNDSDIKESLSNIHFMFEILGEIPKSEYYFNKTEEKTYNSISENGYNIFKTLNQERIKLIDIYNLSGYMSIHENYMR
jgi:hypothetical protein